MSKKRVRQQDDSGAARAPGTAPLRDGWLLAGILLLTSVIYSRSLANGFIYFDDPDVVVNNPYIRQISPANLLHYFTTSVQFMYMPLASISYAIDYQIGGLDPWIYHLDNLVLHLGCVILVYWVFLLLTRKSRIALLVSLFFAVHPVNVDSVSWVATRTTLLATLFYLGALACYSLYVEKGQQRRYLALAWLSFLLAACAKSSAVVLPLTLLLWDYFGGRRWSWKLLVEKVPFLVVALLFGVLTLAMRVDAPPSVHYNPFDRVLVFLYGLANYCVRLVAPLHLSMSYAYPVKHGPWLPLPVYLAPLLLVSIVWGLHKLEVPRKVWIVGLSFFVLNIVLSQSVLLIDSFMANRYAYLAYLGLFLVLADILERLWSAAPAGSSSRSWLPTACAAVLVIVVAGFSFLTYRRTLVWHDSIALLDDVIHEQPGIAWVYGTRGLVKMHTNDLDGAKQDLDQSLTLDPNYTPSLCYRGVVNFRSHDYPAALADLNRALANAPDVSGAYRDRGKVKMALQDEPGALDDFNRAIALDPRSEAHFWRGVLNSDRGDYPGALTDFDAAIANAPDDGEAFYLRGMAKLGLNDQAAACADVARARWLGYQPPDGQAGPSCP